MKPSRRELLGLLAATTAVAACSGSTGSPRPEEPPAPAEPWRATATAALASGAAWLWSQQAADGSFPSQVTGLMAGGASLTGFCLDSLLRLPAEAAAPRPEAAGRALGALVDRTNAAGAIGFSGATSDYPVYATALALGCLARLQPPGWQDLAAPWMAWLRSQQLRGAPWDGHPAQGGFCFGYAEPRVPPEAGHVDLSMSRRAIEALVAAGVPLTDPALAAALPFVARCRAPEGGFIYSPVDPTLNKGGCTDTEEGLRCRGYGSATTDGILALLALGQPVDNEVSWLHSVHALAENPGLQEGQAIFAPAMRAYYRAGAASVFAASRGPTGWAAALVAVVAGEQLGDGRWENPSGLQKENDPLVATGLGLQALAAALRRAP